MMKSMSLTAALGFLQGGTFTDECNDKFRELVKAVDATDKAGKLTISLTLKKSGGALQIVAECKDSTPKPKPESDLLWPTVEGNLSLDNPSQRKLDLQEVAQTRAIVTG